MRALTKASSESVLGFNRELSPHTSNKWQNMGYHSTACGKLLPHMTTFGVLTAMVFTPVSYVAPAREISILVGAMAGAKLLKEGNVKARLIGTTAMVVGLIALSLG